MNFVSVVPALGFTLTRALLWFLGAPLAMVLIKVTQLRTKHEERLPLHMKSNGKCCLCLWNDIELLKRVVVPLQAHLPRCIPPRLPTETITVTCHSPVSFCPHCQASNLHSVPPEGSPWRQRSWWICTISLLTSKHLLTAWHHGSSEPVIVWIHLIPSLSSLSRFCLV